MYDFSRTVLSFERKFVRARNKFFSLGILTIKTIIFSGFQEILFPGFQERKIFLQFCPDPLMTSRKLGAMYLDAILRGLGSSFQLIHKHSEECQIIPL